MNKDIKTLVVVCQNIQVNAERFINPIFVGVESGIMALLNQKLPISFAIGDFDSVRKEDINIIKEKSKSLGFSLEILPETKDVLDSEAAILSTIKQKILFDKLVIVSHGDRWDMILANINLAKKYAKYQPILIDQKNYSFFLKAPETIVLRKDILQNYKYISFFNLSEKEVIYNLSDCKYLPNIDVKVGNKDTLTISNEFLSNSDTASLSVKSGECFVTLFKK